MSKAVAGYEYYSPAAWRQLIESIPASYVVWKDTSTTPATYRAECNVVGGTDLNDGNAGALINQAITSTVAGGKVFIKQGTYPTATVVSVSGMDNIWIESDGAILRQLAPLVNYPFEIIDSTSIHVHGMTFSQLGIVDDGSLGTQYCARVGGTPGTGSQDIRFTQCRFEDAADNHLVSGTTENLLVQDCVFDTAGEHPIYMGLLTNATFRNNRILNYAKRVRGYAPKLENSSHVLFEGNWWEQNEDGAGHGTDHPYCSVLANCSHVTFRGDTWVGDGTDTFGPAIHLDGTDNAFITYDRCKFLDAGKINIETDDLTAKPVYITNCYFDMTHAPSQANWVPTLLQNCTLIDPYYVAVTQNNLTVDRCTFTRVARTHDYPLLYAGSGAPVANTRFTNCKFFNWTYRGLDDTQGTDTTLQGCYFSGGVTGSWLIPGIRLSVKDCVWDGDVTYGVYAANSAHGTDCVWKNNKVDTALTLYLTAATWVTDQMPMTATSLDLSGGATDMLVYHCPAAGHLIGYWIMYTEASSADVDWPVDAIRVGRYQDGVALDDDYFDETVSEASKASGYRTFIGGGSLTQTQFSAGDSITVGTGGGKTGAGAVVVKLALAETM